MRKLCILSIGIMIVSLSQAQPVAYSEARQVAQSFFAKHQKAITQCAYIEIANHHDTLFYVFNADQAYVLIAADKSSVPVLAFSNNTTFQANNIIPPVQMWMDNYANQILLIKQTQACTTHPDWSAWLHPRKDFDNDIDKVAPLLTSKWGQGMYYNYYCPQDEAGTNGRCVTGCVATAMAQLMYYFRFPDTGTASYSYTHDTYGNLSADFGQTHYDYDAMTDVPEEINPAMSLLIHHCGVAVDMVYGPTSSGMYNHKAAYALRTYFKYSPQTAYVFRDSSDLDWDSLIVTHLNNNIPLYYAGWSVPDINGHGFVCDGYQKTDSAYYYHFNFGWDGYMDGYFYTDALSPGGNNFNLAQEIIINAYPDTSTYTYPSLNLTGSRTLTALNGSFDDGSGATKQYPNNMDYTWRIQPDHDSIVFIKLNLDFQIAENDSLFIDSEDDNLMNYVITNDSGNLSLTVLSSYIELHLKTNHENTEKGFKVNYASSVPTYCGVLQMLSTPSGKVEDGSGTHRYNNFTNCKTRLKINGVNLIFIDFTKFETEKDKDILYIYDQSVSPSVLLVALSGDIHDTSFVFHTNTLMFVFQTDEQNTYDGWEFSYTSGINAINDKDKQLVDVKIYPNPANQQFTIEHPDLIIQQVQLYDIKGKLQQKYTINNHIYTFDISQLSQGMYFLKIETSQGIITRKLQLLRP